MTATSQAAPDSDPGSGRSARGDNERDAGSATLATLALASLVVLLAAVIVAVGQFAQQRIAANAAADLSALAAAGRWDLGSDGACAVARRVARDNGGRLDSCEVVGTEVSVVVEVVAPPAVRWAARAVGRKPPGIRAVARAGPGLDSGRTDPGR